MGTDGSTVILQLTSGATLIIGNPRMGRGSGKKRDSTAALDCVTGAVNTTWWDWTDGSHPFFWRWDLGYVATVRDGLHLWYKCSTPKHVVPQNDDLKMMNLTHKERKDKAKIVKGASKAVF
jgi:hypothetical protein